VSAKDTTVIFDLGNVVLFFDHGIICRKLASLYNLSEQFIFQKIFKEGIERKYDDGRLSPEHFTRECSEALGIQLEFLQFKAIWSGIFRENTPVIDIIKLIKKRARVFLLSNTNVWHVEYIRRHFHILELFDELIFSFEVGYIKPDKRIFERAIDLCKGSKQIIYIDDTDEHVRAAKDVGLCGIKYSEPDMLRGTLSSKGLL
jgi:HAD superfamily hydrolase (TIGR01549 family)